jgi:hypothetical protein
MAARLRSLPAATAEARFFGGRRFGDRVVRCERDFEAMFPLTPTNPTMPWPGSGSHAEERFSARAACGKPGRN